MAVVLSSHHSLPKPASFRQAGRKIGFQPSVKNTDAGSLTHPEFGCSTTAAPNQPLSPEQRKANRTAIQNPDFFDSNQMTYDPDAIYSVDGTLTWPQKVCDFLIRKVYQRPTRSTIYKWMGNPCPYKRRAQKLSCSEFTLVMIHRLGVIRGIWEGAKRLLRCNPVTVMRNDYRDPVVNINQLPWRFLPAF